MEEWYFYSCRLNAETLQKVTLVHGYFLRFWNCTNGTKSRKASQMCFRALMMYLMLNSNIWGFRDYKDFIWYKYWHLASTNIKAQQPPPMVKTADFGVSERHLLFNSDKIDFFYMADVALHIFNGFHSMRTFPFTINPFVPNASFLYSLKISQNLMVFTEECIRKKWIKQFYVLQRICILLRRSFCNFFVNFCSHVLLLLHHHVFVLPPFWSYAGWRKCKG